MIETKEINKNARNCKVSDRQIEKDYVLTWVLYAISMNGVLRDALVFKGGTVLKKAYFKEYRFSEDLDFTLCNESLSNEEILTEFRNLFSFIKEESNIDLRIDSAKSHTIESGSLQFYIDYVASLQGRMGSRDLKIDITRGEQIITEIKLKSIFRLYSDLTADFSLQCYSLAEILIEKMTALMGRTEPRDLYDFWYLTEIEKLNIADNQNSFEIKAEIKKHNPTQLKQKVIMKEAAFKKDWQRKLASQIHDLPDFDDVFRRAKRHL